MNNSTHASRATLRYAVAAGATALVVSSLGGPAQATQPGPVQALATAADEGLAGHVGAGGLTAQDPSQDVVSSVADTLWALGRDSGFAGQRVDADARAITVHWKGSVPPAVRAYALSQPLGVSVHLREGAAFTRTQSLLAARRLADSDTGKALGIRSVSVNSDGSGVTARVPATTGRALHESSNAPARAAAAAGTAVRFQAADPLVPTATRGNDSPAWKGGARTLQAGSACSTAFAVLAGTAGRLLSAHHCDTSANASVTDGAGSRIAPGGSSVSGRTGIDSQLIDPSASPATTARVYTGGWNSGTTAVVKNWASNWEGQRVCASGATSGQHCGTIVNDATTVPWASGGFYIEAQAANRGVMVAGGDSGGPVFASVTGGVQARGVILGGSDPVACGAHNPDVAPRCYNNIVYAPISVVLRTWGVRLEVG